MCRGYYTEGYGPCGVFYDKTTIWKMQPVFPQIVVQLGVLERGFGIAMQFTTEPDTSSTRVFSITK
jgi:hypothetical protein